MKYNNKDEIKENAIRLYLEGKNMEEIGKITGCSRNFVGNLIRNDEKIKQYKNRAIVKLYKFKKRCRINVPISVDFWEKIGVSRDVNIDEFIEITVDENNKTMLIRKT